MRRIHGIVTCLISVPTGYILHAKAGSELLMILSSGYSALSVSSLRERLVAEGSGSSLRPMFLRFRPSHRSHLAQL